jgi:tetratricopeptide (TPR) repeat protein
MQRNTADVTIAVCLKRATILGLSLCTLAFTAAAQDKPLLSLPTGTLAQRAYATYDSGDVIGALPMFEELTKRNPDSVTYAESLAFCLSAAALTNPDANAGAVQWRRAGEQAERAGKLGDKSQIEQILLEQTKLPYQPLPVGNGGDVASVMAAAEAQFARGEFDAALAKYKQAYALDPTLYEAALFAGDVEFREHNSAQAATWFARAIAIDPNRETAYRYWGDALDNAGQVDAARDKLIAAIVAQPYERKSSIGLQNWAKKNGFIIRAPAIQLPAAPTGEMKDGKSQTNINISPSLGNAQEAAPWLAYQMSRAVFRTDKFQKAFPAEKTYRNSLREEAESIQAALNVATELKIPDAKLDPNLKALKKLQQEELLESWILLNDADNGIAQDYTAYRDGHREELTKYIREYLIHESVKQP